MCALKHYYRVDGRMYRSHSDERPRTLGALYFIIYTLGRIYLRDAGELDVHLSDLLERQRDTLLSAPLLPGGKFDPALHPARHPLRDAMVGALLTLLLSGLTWCVCPACKRCFGTLGRARCCSYGGRDLD